MHLCLFEDFHSSNFLPLTYFRPVYDLRCGMLTLRERIVSHLLPKSVSLFAREYLAAVLREENPGLEVNKVSSNACLFVNGRTIMSVTLARQLKMADVDCLFVNGEQIIAVRLSGKNLSKAMSSSYADAIDLSNVVGLQKVEVDSNLVSYPWDLVYANAVELAKDFSILTKKSTGIAKTAEVHKAAVLIGKRSLYIGKRSVVGAGAVLDASGGPIFVGNDVRIYPTAVIEGPCYIGDCSTIKVGAKIYSNTSIGPVCKVGGEVEHSIFHSHSNKQHDGFVGHSYLAPWVNLGAGTTTSNLKNTYGSVKVNVNGKTVDSGKMFVGLTAGDHVKIGINGTINAGTVIGPSSNIYGSSIAPKNMPPFTWGTAGNFSTYDVERAVGVATTVMSRRNVIASEAYKQLFRYIFEITGNERIDR
jgi:UDP-N-acetylglucosamine diphosphorylase / glucose-1-phosphate thymidylyltransferase / UDP-N-acetylgalactosamine diphosphorylase / glucosamine-1-phosphate N-acetyltransferase / galactosamine-1-phosphate N-acetyltransferase